MTRMLDRLRRDESGFTLVELLVACLVGMVILLATFMTLDSSVVLTGKVTDRNDRTQRARGAMERVTRDLRSQVCPSAGIPALIEGQNYSVKFYSFMGSSGSAQFIPDIREISWDTNTNSLIEKRWQGSGASPYTTWPSSPTTTRTLLTDVQPPPSNAPIFAFYSTGASTPFGVPLSSSNSSNTSKVTITFRTFAQSKNISGPTITLQNEVFARTADPNGATTSPLCA
jgi:type II secretory pathway component PulJ